MMKELWMCTLFLLAAFIGLTEQSELQNSGQLDTGLARRVHGSFNVWYNEVINVDNPFSVQFYYTRTELWDLFIMFAQKLASIF